jgi:uncharacterized repeat protein (TIGR01451 family)
MFRKLISNLPFSPALVGQLGFYARRLKQEEASRRLGLVLTALALVVQSFAVFAPPESANASNPSDMIRGGVKTVRQVLDIYDRSANGNGDFKQIMDYAGVTRTELAQMHDKSLNSKSKGTSTNAWKTWGRVHRFSAAQGEVTHIIPVGSKTSTVHSRPLWLYDSTSYTIPHGSTYDALVGHSAKLGDFAIMKGCGNLVSTKTPKPAPQAAFIQATCTTIRGFAYDARNKSQHVKVFLYFGGPPGKGTKYGPITTTDQEGNFSYSVPEQYRKSTKATQVWAAMVPLAGWHDSSVQFKNTVTIPGNCVKPTPSPTASCTSLQSRTIERTKFALTARAVTANGAKVTSYEFVVKDKDGKVVERKTVSSSALQAESGAITLPNAGRYSAQVIVHTSVGDKTATNCATTLTVTAPEMCSLNPELPKNHPDCKPCPGNPDIWSKDERCNPVTTQSKEAKNLTQNAEADTVTAQASDRIEYTIYVENVGEVAATAKLDEELTDVLEYSTLQDNGGGTFNSETKVLSWGDIVLKPGEKISRTFTVELLKTIPSTPRGASEPGSYDCIMTNAFGNTVAIDVKCDTPKMVEGVATELPKTGPGENMLFAGILLSVVTYFWARARQTNKEVRLVRKEFNMGTI